MCVSWLVADLFAFNTLPDTLAGVGDLFGSALDSCQPGSPEPVHWHLLWQSWD